MKQLAKCNIVFVAFAFAVASTGVAMADVAAPKFVAYGWDVQSAKPADLLANVDEWDKTPMDGCAICIRIPDGRGGEMTFKTLMNDPEWDWAELEKFVPTLQELSKHRSMKESMVAAFRAPKKRIAWNDDAAWKTLAANMGKMARLAKLGGMKGLLSDPEDYPKTKQFYWCAEDGSYDDAVRMARQRGREVFGAVFREYPDATLLFFWLLTTDRHAFMAHDPVAAMRQIGCLFPAFVDGMLDVITPGAILVDGNETTYRAEATYGDHAADACRQRGNAIALLSPENRDKYRLHHRVGAAFFLDGYVNPPENKWYSPPFNGTRADRLGLNLSSAAATADYVWLDGEWRCYVPWKNVRPDMKHIAARMTWEDAIPGFWKEVRAAKEPLAAEYGKRKVVASAPAMTCKEANHAALVKGVKFGEIYEVTGSGDTPCAYLCVDWKKENGAKWASRAASVPVIGGRAVFRVPQGVDSFAVIRKAGRAHGGEAKYSRVEVAKLEVLSDEDRTLAVAANELQKYWGEITGDWKKCPVRFAVDSAVSKSGNDAYRIVSTGGKPARVVITGSNARSVLYGLYDLLERRAGCRWYWDGDVVPKRKSIDVAGLDVYEESRFRYRGLRYFAHRGLARFQAEHWGLDDWKREIDWLAKKRINLMMLRIGQDDLFQKAFPETCAYPDASRPLPGTGKNFDDRSLFWSLEFRGRLRKQLMEYAFDRGLMAPEDFGTMTHWYSRTPQDFLDKKKPPFLPQATGTYGEPSGLVWDIRQKEWMDNYWKITDAAISNYGREGLLHTIGIAERRVSKNRDENLAMKKSLTELLLSSAKMRHPSSQLLLAGWDLYCMKDPAEVRAFLKNIPQDVVIWDYEADAYMNTNFTEWDVIGKRPYTFGIFMAYEAGLDPRTDYARVLERQRAIEGDTNCVGYILWPESSHVDSMGLEFFAKNAWRAARTDVDGIVHEYCAGRYGKSAAAMEEIWRNAIPLSTNMQEVWRRNWCLTVMRDMGAWSGKIANDKAKWDTPRANSSFAAAPEIFRALAKVDAFESEMTWRDAMDLARVASDRLVVEAENRLMHAYFAWRDEKSAQAGASAAAWAEHAKKLSRLAARLLQLHSDYSLCDTMAHLNAVEKVANPNFDRTLIDNCSNFYCASHQAEMAEHLYAPALAVFADQVCGKIAADDRSPLSQDGIRALREKILATPLESMRSTEPRTQENFRAILAELAAAAEEFLKM